MLDRSRQLCQDVVRGPEHLSRLYSQRDGSVAERGPDQIDSIRHAERRPCGGSGNLSGPARCHSAIPRADVIATATTKVQQERLRPLRAQNLDRQLPDRLQLAGFTHHCDTDTETLEHSSTPVHNRSIDNQAQAIFIRSVEEPIFEQLRQCGSTLRDLVCLRQTFTSKMTRLEPPAGVAQRSIAAGISSICCHPAAVNAAHRCERIR